MCRQAKLDSGDSVSLLKIAQIETNPNQESTTKSHLVKNSKPKKWLFKMRISVFLGQIRIIVYVFCFVLFITANEIFGLQKMEGGGKRISIWP